ncbi:SusC/RagA family TonB-linked outer membrane protein [Fulvivirga sediminis]|uniref:SusC/RagA family TonB-linked outer membrane protein n=1 Tax=Fulvivirga sediminis TaxID=2803949 RepID=A0A937K0W0_9BACT|nr:SusC/RagA family TonB-linked outer membrane protein [Fulvivirga sediminis]MBL3657999.1 SusC/RagA family TonB-linked outer membrane protein [Fulvivirga sediminis]
MKKCFAQLLLMQVMLFTLCVDNMAQTITGKVSTEEGELLPGVSVMVKGSSIGTVTDLGGNYTLDAGEEAALLIFSFIGYKTEEVPIQGRSLINHIMEPEATELEEVVVTALNISREKRALGYAVEQVGEATIEKSGQTNIVNALQGRVAGVTIRNSSGAPGSGADIVIRGMTSLDPNRSNRPLYVIDGVEISDDVDATSILPSSGSNSTNSASQASVANRAVDINPGDIASLTILKGAQATALYGIRAANGAIIITTKKGKKGAPQIDLHFGSGWSTVNKVPKVQRSFIDGSYASTNKRDGYFWDSWGAPVNPANDNTHDIYDDFFKTGTETNYGGSIAGASDNFNYRFSFDRLNQEGVIPKTDFEKTNFNLTTKINIAPKLEATANLMYANTGGHKPHVGDKSILSNLSYVTPMADINHYKEPYSFANNIFGGIIDHPLYLVNTNEYTDAVNRYIVGLGLKYELNEHISINYKIGTDIYSDERKRIVSNETDEGSQVDGFVVEQRNSSYAMTSNVFAQLKYDFGEKFSFSSIVGQYTYIREKDYLTTRGEGLALDGFYNLDNTINIYQANDNTKYRNAAVYGELTLGYQNYLFLSVTGRNDWSSTLPVANNSYFFPSASLSWVLSDMIMMPTALSYLKFRGSYAVVGKDASPYQTGIYFEKASNFPFGDALGFRQSTLIGDESLKPEFTNTLELGADLRLLKNRFGLNFTYYKSDLTDMILSVPISNASGASRYVTNAGSMTNEGIELNLSATPITSGDFAWDVNFNFTKQKGRVEEIDEGIEEIELYSSFGITNKYVRGGKVGDLYGYVYRRSPSGQLIINSETGYPEIDWDTLRLAGNAMPDWSAGMTNSFKYKGFELSVLLEWKHGGDVLDMGRRNSIRNGQIKETERRFEQVVFNGVNELTNEDGEVIGYEPNTTPTEITPAFYRSTTNYNYAAEVLLEDASWFRIRNISISYSFPKIWLQSIHLNSARLSFIAYNVLLSTPVKGYDPETNYFGSGSNIYGYTGLKTPATRSYSVRLNIGL